MPLPDRNWRDGHSLHYKAALDQWRSERANGSDRIVSVPGRSLRVRVRNLTDQQLEELARREAERDMERAINEVNAAQARERQRAGVAL